MLRIGSHPWIGRPVKQPLCDHWRPTGWEPHVYSVLIKLHDPNHWVKPPLSLGCGAPSWNFLFPFCSLFSLQISKTKPVQHRALSDAALGRLRRALLSNSLYKGRIQNPGVKRAQCHCQIRSLRDDPKYFASATQWYQQGILPIQVNCAPVWMIFPLRAPGACQFACCPPRGTVSRANDQLRGKFTQLLLSFF